MTRRDLISRATRSRAAVRLLTQELEEYGAEKAQDADYSPTKLQRLNVAMNVAAEAERKLAEVVELLTS